MKKLFILLIAVAIFSGCAAYKELEPKPEILHMENGYLSVLDGGDPFEFDEDGKYFIKFPRPEQENTYLVIKSDQLGSFNSYLTRSFDDGEGTIIKLPNESTDPSVISVYPVERSVPFFFWVAEGMPKDMEFRAEYRYVAIWRFKFENKHTEFREILDQNTTDRSLYEQIGVSISAAEIDYDSEISGVSARTKRLQHVQGQMKEIASILPANLDRNDPAYRNYEQLSKDLDAELKFQANYQEMLSLMKASSSVKGGTQSIAQNPAGYIALLANSAAFPANVLNEAKASVAARLSGMTDYFERELRKKNDISPINFEIDKVAELYALSGAGSDRNFEELHRFVREFNSTSSELETARDDFDAILSEVSKANGWPSNSFYTSMLSRTSNISYRIPQFPASKQGKYRSYACAGLLERACSSLVNSASRHESFFRRSESLVPQINMLKSQAKYRDIIKLLKQNSDIEFLSKQYADVDEMSLGQQRDNITSAFSRRDWPGAETALRTLHNDGYFLNPSLVARRKANLVESYEDSLLNRVQKESSRRAMEFANANITTVNDVEGLYQNPAFQAVHQITFTSGDPSGLVQKKQALEKTLSNLRDVEFPSRAIDALYKDFSRDPSVLKARAIVVHGNHYNGKTSKFKNLAAEVDPMAAKWITKATDYRKIYVLPVSSNTQGENEYVFRVNLQIPTEAKFPVYDVNIRLPKAIAGGAAQKQWYDKMTFNGKLLKNEGRFSITAPTSANDYESQITPLQVNKTGDNVLEVRFKHGSFDVFEVSLMAQKPIIKKN
jgi:hypothetical protein